MYSRTFVFSKTDEKVNTDCLVEEIRFREEVPRIGNYEISMELTGSGTVVVYTDTGKLVYKHDMIGRETINGSFSLNVCDVIPKGMKCLYEKRSVDIKIHGEELELHRITIKQAKCPTLYAVGDAGVTKQSLAEQQDAEVSLMEWGRIFPAFVEKGVAVSDHVNAGMSMCVFQTEGHYALIQAHLKIGDYLMLQFSREEEKVPDDASNASYRDSLLRYIDETRARGAHPILVTPAEKGKQGVMLECVRADSDICRELGVRYHVPVVDIQKHSEDTAFGLAGLIVREYKSMFQRAKLDAYSRLAGALKERVDTLEWHEVS